MRNKISLTDIQLDKEYEGYLWYSDKEEPLMITQNSQLVLPDERANPFVIEGNLWCESDKTSIFIRFIDGQYFVSQFDLKQIPNDQITELSYLPNRMPGVRKLLFQEIWLPQADPLCNGFEVLKPAFTAFVGFKK